MEKFPWLALMTIRVCSLATCVFGANIFCVRNVVITMTIEADEKESALDDNQNTKRNHIPVVSVPGYNGFL